jgi:hypothetical protein
MLESKSCSLKYGDGDREEAMHKTSKSLNLKSTSRAKSARSREHYPKSRSEALPQRSISVVCSQSRSMAISAKRSAGICSTTLHCWQNFRSQLSALPPCSIQSRPSIMTSKRILKTGKNSLATLPDAAAGLGRWRWRQKCLNVKRNLYMTRLGFSSCDRKSPGVNRG